MSNYLKKFTEKMAFGTTELFKYCDLNNPQMNCQSNPTSGKIYKKEEKQPCKEIVRFGMKKYMSVWPDSKFET